MFLEYFYNHSVIVRMGSFITYTRLYPNLGNYLSLLRHYTGGAHAPTQLTCILGSFFLGCLDKWAIIYLKPTVLGYLILVLMCILFAPISNHKICLSAKQKWIHKFISVVMGFCCFIKLGTRR